MKLSRLERRFIALVMAVAMAFGFMPPTRKAEAAGVNGSVNQDVVESIGTGAPLRGVDGNSTAQWYEDYIYELKDGKIILKDYIGNDTDIFVPQYAVKDGITYQTMLTNKDGWSSIWHGKPIEHIELDGVIFPENCNHLLSVSSLETIILRNIDTGSVTNMSYMFDGCNNLTDLDLSAFDTVNVTDMSGMFNNCSSLESLDLSGFSTGNVTDMSNMFCRCSNLESLDISEFDTGKVTNMSSMFYCCAKLKNLDISGFDTGYVTNMSKMFGAMNFTNLDLSGFDTSKVEDMSDMFNECTISDTLILSGFDTSNVEDMHRMFCGLNIDRLDLSGFDTGNVTNMSSMFLESQINTLDISGFDTSNVTDMSSMFSFCRFESLNLSHFDTSSVVSFKDMFSECFYLKQIDMSGWNTSSATNMSRMFLRCKALESIDVSGFDTRKVTDMSAMFAGCEGIQNLELTSFDTKNVTSMNSMFSECSNLKTINISGMVTDNLIDILYMFEGCSNLVELDLSNYNFSCVDINNEPYQEYLNYNELPFVMFGNCGFRKIKTPVNCSIDIALPGEYVDKEGNTYVTLPKNLSSSLELERVVTYSAPVWTWNGTESASARFTNVDDSGDYTDVEATITSEVTTEPTANMEGVRTYTATVVFNGSTYTTTTTETIPATGGNDPVEDKWYEDYQYDITGDTIILKKYNGDKAESVVKGSVEIDGYNYKVALKNYNTAGDQTIWWNASTLKTLTIKDGVILPNNCTAMFSSPYLESISIIDTDSSNATNMEAMFYNCSKLTSVDLSGLNTSNVNNMRLIFYGCSSLKTLDLSSIDTSEVTDMTEMFSGCSSLELADLSALDTGRVTCMQKMFSGCKKLQSIILSGFNTSKVKDMSRMFEECSSLESLDLSGIDTGNVENMNGMFSQCTGLNSIDLNNINTSNVTDMYTMFYNCSSLKFLNLSSFDTGNVESMGCMFYGCSGIESLDLSGMNTSKVTSMNAMFQNCSSLKTLDISGFDTSKATDMQRMFSGCNKLQAIDVSGFDTSKVTSMREMFDGCYNLSSLNLSGFNTGNVTTMCCMFYDCSNLQTIDVSGFDTSKVVDVSGMFYNCVCLQKIDLSSFDMTKVTNAGNMLSYTYSVTEIKTPKNLTKSVPTAATFYDDEYNAYTQLPQELDHSITLTLNNRPDDEWLDDYDYEITNGKLALKKYIGTDKIITVPKSGIVDGVEYDTTFALKWSDSIWGGTVVEEITFEEGIVFPADCYMLFYTNSEEPALKKIDMSGADTSNVTNMGAMFSGCKNLEDLDISGIDTSSVTNMSGMFSGCSKLTSIDISDFNTEKVTDMSAMFKGCSNLESIDLHSFNTVKVTKMGYMFENCAKLEEIDISGFSSALTTEIQEMFTGCESLKELDLSGLDLSMLDQGSISASVGIFGDCYSLDKIYSPKNLTKNVALPGRFVDADQNDYNAEGNVYKYLPKNKQESILLERSNVYSEPDWTWNSTYSSATAMFMNPDVPNDDHQLTATITNRVTKAATYAETGVRTYTATVEFNGETYTDTKTEDIPALGYTYGDFKYDYNNSGDVVIMAYIGTATSVEIPSVIEGKSVVSINAAFKDNKTITDVVLPSSVTTLEYGAFSGASSLKNINLENVERMIIGSNFYNCTSLSDIVLPENIYMSSGQFNGAKMDSITIPCIMNDGDTVSLGYFETGEMKFAEGIENVALSFGGIQVPEIIIPDTVTQLAYSRFSNVNTSKIVLGKGLQKIPKNVFAFVPDTMIVIGENVKVIEPYAFEHNYLKTLVIPDNVTEIQYMAFCNSQSLENITFSKNLTRVVGGYDGFMKGSPWYNNQSDGVVYTGGALYAYKGSVPENTAITVKSGTKGIGYMALQPSDGSGSNIKSVTLPDSLTYIGGASFFNTGITEVTIPENVTEIAAGAFANTELDSVFIPSTVQVIGQYAFGYKNDNLKGKTAWVLDDNWSNGYSSIYNQFGSSTYPASKVDSFKIIGYKGTAAEQYAIDNGFAFVDANETVCQHANMTEHPAVPATCTKAGNSAYWSCSDCGKYFSDSAGQTEIEENSWVINANGHNLTKHVAVASTCTTAGNSAYWSCSDCGKYFSDSAGKTEINKNSWVIKAKGHNMTEHKAVAATCTTAGNSAYWSCSECGKYYSDSAGKTAITKNSWVIAAKGHNLTEHKAVEATCTKAGNSAYWSCSECGKYYSDSVGKTAITKNSWVIAAKGHSYGVPTWSWTGTSSAVATFTCKNGCGHSDKVTSTITNSITTPATCTTKGVRTYTASVTFKDKSYKATKTTSIAAKGHSYGAPTWSWTGTSSAVATFTCKTDRSHTKKLTAIITNKVTTKATVTTAGVKTYTAAVTLNDKTYKATKTEKIYVFDKSKTGLQKYNNVLYYVKNGVHYTGFTGFAKYGSDWYYVVKGKIDTTKKDVLKGTVNGENAWWYVSGGKVQFINSVEKNSSGWWCIQKGKVNFNYTGFAKNSSGWWYCEKGKVNFAKKDVLKGTVNSESGWWFVSGGKVQFINSVEKNSNGWWCIQNGKANFNYTGIASNSLGLWYCKGGKVQFGYSGKITYNGKTYTIKNGKVIS